MNEWWRVDGWPTADEWQALWAFATLVVAVVAAWLALRQYPFSVGTQIEKFRFFFFFKQKTAYEI